MCLGLEWFLKSKITDTPYKSLDDKKLNLVSKEIVVYWTKEMVA